MRSLKFFCKTRYHETLKHPQNSRLPWKHTIRRRWILFILPAILGIFFFRQIGHARDYLSDKEIELLQDTRSVAKRTRISMNAAALRLKTASDKLFNKEYEAGDPMELLLPEEVMEDYCKILHSVQLNVAYAVEKPHRTGNETVEKALTTLKEETEKALRSLEVLQRIAKEKQRDTLLDHIQDAIELTQETLDDASEKLAALRPRNPSDK
jgi:hypothetical protein